MRLKRQLCGNVINVENRFTSVNLLNKLPFIISNYLLINKRVHAEESKSLKHERERGGGEM